MIRTPGILLPKQARYQLRYAPIQFCGLCDLLSRLLPKQVRYQLCYTLTDIVRIYYTIYKGIVNRKLQNGSDHKAQLKEVNESKRDFSIGMVKAVVVLGNTKTIISSNKDFYHCIKSFQLSRETPASSGKDRDIMAQVSVDTLNSKGILLASPIVNMPSRIYHILSHISVCAISADVWCGIHDLLYPL